jgi:DNA polymerase elongation subunit (family B)
MRDPEIMAKVKAILEKVEAIAPGKSVELRIPPYAAIQCVAGSSHRRGTPPNVVEMDADSLMALASGSISWEQALDSGKVLASGAKSDLSAIFDSIRISK